MTPATKLAGGVGRSTRWTREAVIEKIHEWVAMYGEPPRAADWNPSSAKWCGQTWRIARYDAGDWPSLNAAKRPFGGSLNAALVAAGYEPNRSGPPKRARVGPELLAGFAEMHPQVRVELDAARADARDAVELADRRSGQLARARAHVARLEGDLEAARRARRVVTRTKTKTKTKTVVRRDAAAERRANALEAQLDEARATLPAARVDAAEARRDATRMAAKLERAEATIHTLRDERRELKTDAKRADDRLVALERATDARLAEMAEALDDARARPTREVTVLSVEAREVRDAQAAEARARRTAQAAEERAARAERELRETVAAITGEERKLTRAELADLRAGGPSGPSVLAGALKRLAAARARGGKAPLAEALAAVASAAVRWSDTL